MSQQSTTALLWINKDATNVHRKKHVAEVNAHVQKSSSKKRVTRKPVVQKKKKTILPAHDNELDKSSLSPGTSPVSSNDDNATNASENEFSLSVRSKSRPNTALSNLNPDERNDGSDGAPALIFSSYLEDETKTLTSVMPEETTDIIPTSHVLGNISQASTLSLPADFDASNPLPGLMTGLSSHDRMLVHTHLTYMPQLFYGFSNRTVYCPIRMASVANMLREPVGTMWVLIALEMFLETVRGSNERKKAILQKKNYAYHLMAKVLKDPAKANDENILLGPAAAAIAELFCGDPTRAITHLNGIDAFIAERGGLEYISRMNLTVSMPIFAVAAYRTILQDNLIALDAFERAHTSFIDTIRKLIAWNKELASRLASGPSTTDHPSPQDEGFDGCFDLNEGLREFQQARRHIFSHHPLMRKFVDAEFACTKPGEKVDHFILLYNLNRALADHAMNFKHAAQFAHDLLDYVETGGSTRGPDSSIKISGVLRLFTHRQSKMHPQQPSLGIALAWNALDALEIMKLLSSETQRTVRQTLHRLLIGQVTGIMTEDQIVAMHTEMVDQWQSRHPFTTALHS